MMKRIFTYAVLLLIAGTMTAQDCVFYFPSGVGTKVGYNYYSKPGKPEGSSILQVTRQKVDNGNLSLDIRASVFDVHEDTTISFDYTVWCEGGNFYIDMRSFLGSMDLAELGEFKITSTDMELPSRMTAGQQLKDASFTIEMEGPIPMTMTSDFTNRKVEAIEKVTTPAGTFDCIRISYNTFSKVAFIKTEGRAIEWYARDVGLVRSEYYDKKGRMTGSHELNYIRQ